MIAGSRVLALIVARGGSKGVPRKNILDVAGRPLIAWTIEAARASAYVDRVVLSSDDPEIIKIATASGCEAPFVRPAHLATDTAGSVDVALHALEQCGPDWDYLVFLQPTSPLRTARDIDACLEKCQERNVSSCVAVRAATEHPELMFRIKRDETLEPLLDAPTGIRRQEFGNYGIVNGAVYVVRVREFLERRRFIQADTVGYEMPAERSLDIDTLEDLEQARKFLQAEHHCAGK